MLTVLTQAVSAGSEAISGMCVQMEEWAAQVGKPKRTDRVVRPEGLEELVAQLTTPQLEEAFR